MTARGGVPTPTELLDMWPRGVPTYLLGIAERRHRNLPSMANERNPAVWHLRFAHQTRARVGTLRPNLVFVITFRKIMPRT
jgi:hypothetical protein